MTRVTAPSVGFVDDEPAFLEALQQQETAHISIRTTEQASVCLEWVKHGIIDVLVADLRMPVRDGLTILEEAQKLRDVRVVLLTGFDLTETERTRAQQLGAKVFRKDSLRDLLEYLDELKKDLEVPVDQLEMQRLRQRVKMLEDFHEEWVEDLISMLKQIPDLERATIASSDGLFTVAQLIEDIQELRPRGREYIRLWRRTVRKLLQLEERRDR